MRWKNWKTLMFCVLGAITALAIPITRSVLLWILPLGSGVDDLIFFALILLAAILLMIRAAPVKDKLRTLARWLSK